MTLKRFKFKSGDLMCTDTLGNVVIMILDDHTYLCIRDEWARSWEGKICKYSGEQNWTGWRKLT